MDQALLVALSRQTALQRQLEVVANNIANINTTGFKADGAVFAEFLKDGTDTASAAASRRVSFVQDAMSWHDMSQGTMQQTGAPLDIALDGDGMFAVETPRGERYTRNGALQINASGELVTLNGDRVLGENGPIVFQNTDRDVIINKDGIIKVREGTSLTSDSTRGKIRVVTFTNPQQLRKEGAGTFAPPDGVAPEPMPDANVHIMQGVLEKSNVRSVMEMTRMIQLTRAYSDVAAMLAQQNELKKNSIQQLAEVPA